MKKKPIRYARARIADSLWGFLHNMHVNRAYRRKAIHWCLILWIAGALAVDGAHQADVAFLLLSVACEV